MTSRCTAPALALLLLLLLVLPAAAADDPGTTAQRIPLTHARFEIDGVLDDAGWKDAWTCDLDYEVRPGENVPAPVRTEVLVTYDDRNLYVGFRAYDPDPAAIRAHLSDRDAFGGDDWVGIVLDTFNDERRNFLLLVNPYGVQLDQIERTNADSVGWDGIWDSAARITSWGWAAELRIPFSSLSFQRVDGPQVWGFDAIRGYPRSVFRQMGAFPRDRNNNCYLCQAVKITGFEGIEPGKNLEVNPTVTAWGSDVRSDLPDGPLEQGDREAEAGITARWGITPNLVLGGTLNPDFSQVEADALQLDINEPFALFYEEKRPFFMEASDFFQLPLNIVYTRTIRDPSWGVKLTGKEGAHTIGSYVVRDEVTNLLFPGSQSSDATSLDMDTLDAVVRYKYDVGNRYTLGVVGTSRDGDGYHNRVVGFDGDFRLTDTDRVRVLALRSSTRYPGDVAAEFGQPEGTFEDWAGEAVYSRNTRNLDYYVHLRSIGNEFRADQGFLPMVGYRGGEIGVSYDWLPEADSWYTGLTLEGMVNTFDDDNGDLLLRQAQLAFTYQGPLQSHAMVRVTRSREAYANRLFDHTDLFVHNCMTPSSAGELWVNVYYGDRIDYANAQLGRRLRIAPGVEHRFGAHLLVRLDEDWERMTVDAGELYTASITQLTAAFQFTARTLIRAVVQRVHYSYATELYTDGRDSEYERWFSQLLYSYTINPRTVLFLGYTENRRGNHEFDPRITDRTLFAKVGYAWTP